MNIGSFDIQMFNSDGSVIVRWYDIRLRKNFQRIIKNPDDLFQPMLKDIWKDRDKIVSLFNLYKTDTLKFFEATIVREVPYVDFDGYESMVTILEDDQPYDFMTPKNKYNSVEQSLPIDLRERMPREQLFNYEVTSFTYAYNAYHGTDVDPAHVIPIVQNLM